MAKCPNCNAEISWSVAACGTCRALFEGEDAWRPIPENERERMAIGEKYRKPPPQPEPGDGLSQPEPDDGLSPPVMTVRMSKHWGWLSALLFAELYLALEGARFAASPAAVAFVELVAAYTPVIHNFDSTAGDPAAVRLFLAATLCLLPAKVAFWFLWLHSGMWANYRQLVVSPLTRDRPAVAEFAVAPYLDPAKHPAPRRSMFGRIVWSLLALGLAAMFAWLALDYGWDVRSGTAHKTLNSIQRKYAAIAQGGFEMWLVWAVLQQGVAALALAVGLAIVRDYLVFFGLMGDRLVRRVREALGSAQRPGVPPR